MRTLPSYNPVLGIQFMGRMWAVRPKTGIGLIECAVSTHPLGWELKVSEGDLLLRSKICKTQRDVTITAETWKDEATQSDVRALANI